jgi:hypothetical protein
MKKKVRRANKRLLNVHSSEIIIKEKAKKKISIFMFLLEELKIGLVTFNSY